MEREKVLVSAEETARQKEYMDKVQNLMQMSKDMIRGNA